MFNRKPKHVLVCRNDVIGDVILSFAICGVIKKFYPECKVTLLGTNYTKEVAAMGKYIDDFLNYDELLLKNKNELRAIVKERRIETAIFFRTEKITSRVIKRSGIRKRIGNAHDLDNWFTCNRLVSFSRSKSALHEVQINLKLLKPIGIDVQLTKEELVPFMAVRNIPVLEETFRQLLSAEKFNLIIHPKTTGNGVEWSLDNFASLIKALDKDRFKIFISGSKGEGAVLADWIQQQGNAVTDITGLMSITQFVAFIHASGGLIAGSTGPLHIAAAMGVHALGLFPDINSKDARRWAPIGVKGEYLQSEDADINGITAEMVFERVGMWKK